MLLYGAEIWITTKRRDSKIQAMEMKFLRVILNKTGKDRIRSINIGLELGVDKIKNDIQKSRLTWFVHVMWMEDEIVPKKILYTKMEGK